MLIILPAARFDTSLKRKRRSDLRLRFRLVSEFPASSITTETQRTQRRNPKSEISNPKRSPRLSDLVLRLSDFFSVSSLSLWLSFFLGVNEMDQQQYTELAELAGGFIHEIKNHLSTLGLNLQLLGEDFAEPQNQRERRALERVQRLQKECTRLVDVSNDFLRFARIMDLHLEPTD